MDYFKILNLIKEPFSNSPDPEFFFHSRQHHGCLQKLEISLRMRRGLNVVLGEVGTGKTTICRQLIRNFSDDSDIQTHLILDPDFCNSTEFLTAIATILDDSELPEALDDWQIKERIKSKIFRLGVDQKKTVVLIIDEGQKIPLFCLEILREFLNYETNEYKLLQILIFAQKEFEQTLHDHANFADRVNLFHLLEPLNFRDTRLMIQYRVQQSSDEPKVQPLFTYPALWAIYRSTGGYPRKIINLCHQGVLAMIIQNRPRAGWFLIRSCIRRALAKPVQRRRRLTTGFVMTCLIAVVVAGGFYVQRRESPSTENLLDTTQIGDTVPTNRGVIPEVSTASALESGSVSVSIDALDEPETETSRVEDMEMTQPALTVSDSVEVALVKEDADTKAEEAVQETSDLLRPPLALGRVGLKKNETLSWMCTKVYGMYDHRIAKLIASANPNLGNPNYLPIGRTIVFPAEPVSVKPLRIPVWWVKIAEVDSIESAFEIIRDYKTRRSPARILPSWNAREGLTFAVILWGYFFDEVSAKQQLGRLSEVTNLDGTVFADWGEGTVFFGNPFFKGG